MIYDSVVKTHQKIEGETERKEEIIDAVVIVAFIVVVVAFIVVVVAFIVVVSASIVVVVDFIVVVVFVIVVCVVSNSSFLTSFILSPGKLTFSPSRYIAL